MKKTEIYILGGFLGSGKTTLLRNIIKEEKKAGRKIAVLLNELGSISVDTGLIGEDVPLKELFDGCICCSIQDKLEVQLQELLTSNDLDSIYIETTGAAHPVEVLDSIMSPLFAEQLIYKGIVGVVDLLRWKDREKLPPHLRQLLFEQIRHADLILLNKQDLVSEIDAGQILFSIQNINPKAFCLLTSQAGISLEIIRNMNMQPKDASKISGSKHSLQLEALVHRFKDAIKQQEFEEWLRSLPDTIYRMKGYIKFTHSDYPYLFQYTYGMPLFLQEGLNLPLNLVIIGEELDKAGIVHQLENLG
ncbi:CobW family GTP-binding protein [Peribacillus sp. B-H-3]|uniref:CobW family GTP-binding protein n=1 Tax=Peribacillus sp. B-H-3 TaxID=3400420 RepID=UPI003B02EBC8